MEVDVVGGEEDIGGPRRVGEMTPGGVAGVSWRIGGGADGGLKDVCGCRGTVEAVAISGMTRAYTKEA